MRVRPIAFGESRLELHNWSRAEKFERAKWGANK